MTFPPGLDERFRAAAGESGLLDAAYDELDSPIGTLCVGATERGLCRILFWPDVAAAREQLARDFGTRVLRASKPVENAKRELDERPPMNLRSFHRAKPRPDR